MTERWGKNALLEQWQADGLTTVFGNPGTVEQGLLDALEHHPAFQYVLALQETVAIGIADGYARATAGPALVQLHTGVGLGNGIGMLYQAMRGHSPLVVIAGEAGVKYDAMDSQMATDLVAMARPVTKYATRVTHPDSLLRVMRRAVKTAMTEPRGPVFVALPMDVLDAVNTEYATRSTIPSRAVRPVPDELDRAVAALDGARNPIILMGDGISVSGAQRELVRVAEALRAPVWGLDNSELNMDNRHPLYRGQLGHMFGSVSRRVVADADAVLIVGTYTFPEVFPELADPFAEQARIVHIDLDDYEIAKNFPVDVALVADPKATLAALADRLGAPVDPAPSPLWTPPALTAASPLIEHLSAALAAHTDDLVLFDEALTASPGLLSHLPQHVPGNYFLTRGGSLGIGIPGAIGAKIARPEATVVGVTGDGGSMYTIQALWTAARYGVAAKFVICNNYRYQLLDLNIEQYWQDSGVPSHRHPDGFDLRRPDISFVDLAKGLGVEALRVEEVSQVEPAVRKMLDHDGPFLIDLLTA
ncbi:thiamine pyrophosphate-binding protein [Saccharothrix sp. ALI-22-I]|uniref:thiamine pyrophosphate-binding protein n=1 Tax=Saccharothrix sp. ALI-22-I TaxID=1933778 RepID=UPI00097C58B5|nr:thiamine pyrophosphate-binding protein [Saccharothrix sp. ALI-22-I]ONI84775.1 thiamine pyrophosphate-binding protein [Saccharothrix sp. ALI-22-I]